MKRLVIFALLALFCVTNSPQAAPFVCKDGALSVYHYTPSFGFGHLAPCGWKITLHDAGRVWQIAQTGRVPLTITPLNDNCRIKEYDLTQVKGEYSRVARIKVLKAPCVFDLRLKLDYPFVWYFYMWDVAQVTVP